MWTTAALLAAIASYTWFLEPRLPRGFVALPAVFVLALGVLKAARTGEWGFSRAALWPAARATAAATIPALLALLAAGAARGTLHRHPASSADFAALVAWGGAQQWLLQTVVLREAQHATSRPAGVVLAAVLFAGVHLPNPFLSLFTLVGALAWCAIYDRHPNVVPLALSHALLTIAVLSAFDDAVSGRLRIGDAYLRLRQTGQP